LYGDIIQKNSNQGIQSRLTSRRGSHNSDSLGHHAYHVTNQWQII